MIGSYIECNGLQREDREALFELLHILELSIHIEHFPQVQQANLQSWRQTMQPQDLHTTDVDTIIALNIWSLLMLNEAQFHTLYNMQNYDVVNHWSFESSEGLAPEGFHFRPYFSRRSPVTGQHCPGSQGLYYLLTNVVYLGHWVHKEVITLWDNHEAIIPHELFMYAYNRLCATDFCGEPNPDYAPYKVHRRQPKHTRNVEHPTYSGMIFSDDVPEKPHKRISTTWRIESQSYEYKLTPLKSRYSVWYIKSDHLDKAVDEMLLERLRATTVDEHLWADDVAATQGDGDDIRHWESEIKREKSEQDNIIASIRTLNHPDMVRRAQAQYEGSERRVVELEEKIAQIRASQQRDRRMLQARPALKRIVENWENVPRSERRNL